ncbi:rod shape-determining protein [Candidatus Parcubacteria bacterium]|nr:rod shape-determining protein [Candidatus Parcubacteria bacterium]
MKFGFQSMFSRRLGIDLGTANTLVYVPGRGVVINEPSIVAISVDDNRVLAVGLEAKNMLGRTPAGIIAAKPLRDGVIADYRVTEAMLRYLINKAGGRLRLFRPEVMVAVPAGITSTERRAVVDAATQAGARATYIVKEPIVAAIGAGIPVNTPAGHMIVDIGGGTTEVAVISLGGIVASASARVGGDKIDQAIMEEVKKKKGLVIGERTAEEIKMAIGSATPVKEQEWLEVRGRDLAQGLPKIVEISTNEVTAAMTDQLREIIQTVKKVLQETPPELAADIMDRGMVLSGGGALLRNIDTFISEATSVPATIAKDPLLCVARGTGVALEHLDIYKRSIMLRRS